MQMIGNRDDGVGAAGGPEVQPAGRSGAGQGVYFEDEAAVATAENQGQDGQHEEIAGVDDTAGQASDKQKGGEGETPELQQVGQQGEGETVEGRPVDGDPLDGVDAGQADQAERAGHVVVVEGVGDGLHGGSVGAAREDDPDVRESLFERRRHLHDLDGVGLFSGDAGVGDDGESRGRPVGRVRAQSISGRSRGLRGGGR